MPDYDYTIFDTAAFGVTALTEFILFQVPQGGDATHIESFTNMRGAGQFPQGEDFLIEKVSVWPDYAIPQADVKKWHQASFLEIRVSDRTVFKAPLAELVDNAAYSGSDVSTAGANLNNVGLVGFGFELKIPIKVSGGTAFRVRVIQGTALAGANSNIKVSLRGTLSLAA